MHTRKAYIIIAILLLTFAGFHYVIFGVIIPKTATLVMPFKWRRIPLRQNKETVHGYFGTPVSIDNQNKSEEWVSGSKDKMYVLKVYYVSDTIAAAYSIHYKYHKWFSSRDYVIDSSSIR